ncbi:MAG TPA: ATP-binding protein [Candidatus Sulfotelmatobacter sp.]|nr:ATP-binding protein [Candidatus Sulfotelmatobacter sp.]
MLRRKTIIVLAITLMVTAMVTAFSYLYISQILRLRIANAYETATSLSHQLAYAAGNVAPDFGSTKIDTSDPVAIKRALTEYMQEDVNLNNLLLSDPGDWRYIYDAAIVDVNGKALLHSNVGLQGKLIEPRPDFDKNVVQANLRQQIRLVFSPAAVYDVTYPLQLNATPFGTIRIGVQTVFLKSEVQDKLRTSAFYSGALIILSFLLAAGISNIALGPLKQINRNLDSVTAGEGDLYSSPSEHDEYGLVSLKIANLGRQIRDSKEIFSALKDNVDQLMSKLQDGLMLFSRDSRVVLVSAPVESFLGRPRGELLGRTVQEVFDRDSLLGSALLDSFERRRPMSQREFDVVGGKRVEVSLDFVQEKNSQIGALLVMRDTEPVRRIGDEIEMSRRLSASSRVTRGVAHEVKNPINAIVLHLQLLQNKLAQQEPDTRRHMDIIDSEIRRLDRVVQTLVDFTRPRDLHLEDIDLRQLLEDVVQLAAPDAEQHGVTVDLHMPNEKLPVKVDIDLMKQAILNVVINGVQAMTQGGLLTISARRENGVALAEVQDQGGGIPKDLHDKVFELYFTTKKEGSGIGLAQTYQILQWHYGSVDFESADKGTIFRFQIPMAAGSNTTGTELAVNSVEKSA